MKSIIKFFIVAAVVTIFLTACDKETYRNYVVDGRVIDKTTGTPIEGIFVSYAKDDNLLSQEQKTQKLSPIEYDSETDANGNFIVYPQFSYSQVYFYGYSNGYRDTIISVDFSNVMAIGTEHRSYKGCYIICLGDVALEKYD